MERDKVILERKQLPSAGGSEMSILIKTFIFKYISWFICSDMCLLHAIIQTAGLRKLEKGIWIKNKPYDQNKEMQRKDKSSLCFSFSSVHMSDGPSGMCPLLRKGLRTPLQKSGVSGPSWVAVGRAPLAGLVRLCTGFCLHHHRRPSPAAFRS